MQLTETVKLHPAEEQDKLVRQAMDEYIRTVNSIVSDAMKGNDISKLTSRGVVAAIPSAMKNQCIRDARSIVKKHYSACHKAVLANRKELKRAEKAKAKAEALKARNEDHGKAEAESEPKLKKAPHLPILKKPCIYVNNQNFKVNNGSITIPVLIGGKCKQITIAADITDRQKELFGNKLGMLRIVVKRGMPVAQVTYEIGKPEPPVTMDGEVVMGVDLGIKCPAVSYCSDGSIKFYGNGRKNRYIRRHYAYLRKKAQQTKKKSAIRKVGSKESRIMQDIDHKISRDIVRTAKEHGVSTIRMEELKNIRSSARQSCKNRHKKRKGRKYSNTLHSWSFYRLMKFIEYKAALEGIRVELVDPAYTSQRCPGCGRIHKADDRDYRCECGFHTHRDIVGAMNICSSTEPAGNRQAAQGVKKS